ncbi:hypothetical protein JCM1840_006934 [Sporobolomyces johnsonii]
MNGFSPLPPAPAPAPSAEPASAPAPPSHSKLDLPPASSSLPTPPTTSIEQPSSPPLSHPEAYPASSAPAAVAEQLSAIPPPPVVSLPSNLDLPAKLVHQDSASSLAAQPPTPVPSGARPPPPPPPAPAPSAAPHYSNTPEPPAPAQFAPPPPQHLNGASVNGANGLEAQEAHAGLGMGAHGEGHAQQSAVDVLADVAMGEAALGLADFAAGAGSADVKEEGAVAMSPPLKRSAPESDGTSGAINGMFAGAMGEEEREAKRPRVDETPAEVCCPSFPLAAAPAPYSAPPAPAPPPPAPAPAPAPAPVLPPPTVEFQQPAVAAPSPSPAPSAAVPPPAVVHSHSPLPSASPVPPAPVQGYDPSAFTTAPTLASSAPPNYPSAPISAPAPPPPPPAPPAAAAPTISPSDLHHLPSASPLAVPPQAHTPSASPLPSPAMPIPAPTVGAAPTPSPTYASPDAFAAQVQHQQQQYAPQQQPYPPVASSSHHQPPQPPAPAPPPAAPIAVMTKEQQKHAINLVRNLKRNKNAPPFLKPVDHIALLIPDYYKIIVNPMDLGTIESKLQATGKAMTMSQKAGRIYGLDYSYGQQPGALWEGQQPDGVEPKSYRTVHEFKEDLDRIWENCFRYNGPREKNPVSAMAGIMQDAAEKAYRAMPFAPAVDPYPPRHASPEIKREPRPAPGFVPAIRRSEDNSSRPKREIHAPAKDLPYLESAGVDPLTGGPIAHGGKSRHGRISSKGAQEQLRFCKEVIKELFKKVHEPYAYPFYQPVDVAAYPTYLEYVKRPMDLSTIRSKLEHNQYPVPPYQAFEHDVRLIFKNCYAFNPPGTVVNDWGHKLEGVFERKWEERPTGEDDDDLSDDDGLTAMEQQLQALAANIEMMRQSKKKEKEAKRLASIPARPAPKPAKKPQQAVAHNPYAMPPRQPPGGGGAHKKAGGRPSGGGGGGAHKKKKRRDDDSDDYYEDDGGAYYGGSGAASSSRRHAPQPQEEFVDFEMKRELAVKIVSFEGEQLEEAINIIRRGRPDLLGDANKEIELDIDQLDQRTLLALYRYVCPDSRPALAAPAAAARAPKAPKGGAKAPRNQRKNLDEEKESERIEALEARLREFDQTSGAGTPGAAGAAGDLASRRGSEVGLGGGDEGDQASSDSSDEASSDSESEDEE